MKTEKTSQTITNSNKAARPQDIEPMSFKILVEGMVGRPYHEVFMTGKDIRDRGDRVVLEASAKFKITLNQHYQPSKRKIVKPAKFWSEIKSSKQPLLSSTAKGMDFHTNKCRACNTKSQRFNIRI